MVYWESNGEVGHLEIPVFVIGGGALVVGGGALVVADSVVVVVVPRH